MITQEVDKTLALERLHHEMMLFRYEIKQKWNWYVNEQYIDRGKLDPFYIIQFEADVDDAGDDLYDQELFVTPYPCMKAICMTRDSHSRKRYWVKMPQFELIGRLDRFMEMYTEDYLQPPGNRSYDRNRNIMHDKMYKRRFIFEVRSPRKGIVGIGSQMFARFDAAGAVFGHVFDIKGNAMEGVEISLVSDSIRRSRITQEGGVFWFSKVQAGEYSVSVNRSDCLVRVIQYDEFGNVKGWFLDRHGKAMRKEEVSMIAPDTEGFLALTDEEGKFVMGPVPDFDYYLKSGGDFVAAEKVLRCDSETIVGTIQSQIGEPVYNQKITLVESASKREFSVNSDYRGHFIFSGLAKGNYTISIQGKLFVSKQYPDGKIAIALVVYNYFASEQRIDRLKYLFKNKTLLDVL